MSAAPEPWLPPSPDGDVERAAAAFLAPWATEWFPWPDQVRVRTHAGRAGEDLSWSGAAGAGVGLSSAARTKLGLALADGRADTENPADCELLGKIADMAVADLAGRLAGQGGSQSGQAEPSIDGHTMLRISLGDERWFLLLSIGPRARIALRKAAAGQARNPVLGSLAEALAPEVVPIGCHIGSADLSAGDIANLAAGDLIALDRRVAEDLPLTVVHQVAPGGKARIVDDGAGPVVRIVEGIDFRLT